MVEEEDPEKSQPQEEKEEHQVEKKQVEVPQPLKTYYEWIDKVDAKTTIEVRQSWENEHASLYINNQEVVKIRASHGELHPADRAKIAASKLYLYLSADGNPNEIIAVEQENRYFIQAGKQTILEVDQQTAELATIVADDLSKVWTNQIRKSLGASTLPIIPKKDRANPENLNYKMTNFESTGVLLRGEASWYGPGFHGRTAADGSRYNMYEMTAAHKSLKFGTMLRVVNHKTGKTCIVKITDRGPYIGNRIIDLSKAAAEKLGMLSSGVSTVTAEIITPVNR